MGRAWMGSMTDRVSALTSAFNNSEGEDSWLKTTQLPHLKMMRILTSHRFLMKFAVM